MAPTVTTTDIPSGTHRWTLVPDTDIVVSTIVRTSSAIGGSGMRYFETMAFADANGVRVIVWESTTGGLDTSAAYRQHDLAVRWLSRNWR